MLQLFIQNLSTEEEKGAFTALYYQYRDYLFVIAKDILRDWHLAEDAVIEAFLRVSLHFSKIDPQDSPKTKRFLVIVIRSVCFDMLRRQKRDALYKSVPLVDEEGNDLVENLPDDRSDPAEELLAMTGYEAIRAAIDRMDGKYRDVLYLRCVMDYSIQEVATLLGVSQDAVYKRLQRARKILSEVIAQDEV